jgi:hypothetical protein
VAVKEWPPEERIPARETFWRGRQSGVPPPPCKHTQSHEATRKQGEGRELRDGRDLSFDIQGNPADVIPCQTAPGAVLDVESHIRWQGKGEGNGSALPNCKLFRRIPGNRKANSTEAGSGAVMRDVFDKIDSLSAATPVRQNHLSAKLKRRSHRARELVISDVTRQRSWESRRIAVSRPRGGDVRGHGATIRGVGWSGRKSLTCGSSLPGWRGATRLTL